MMYKMNEIKITKSTKMELFSVKWPTNEIFQIGHNSHYFLTKSNQRLSNDYQNFEIADWSFNYVVGYKTD